MEQQTLELHYNAFACKTIHIVNKEIIYDRTFSSTKSEPQNSSYSQKMNGGGGRGGSCLSSGAPGSKGDSVADDAHTTKGS